MKNAHVVSFINYSYFFAGQKRGMEIWILGIVERESNRLVLYPVNERSRETLVRK